MGRINIPFSPGSIVEKLQKTSWPNSLKNMNLPVFGQTYPGEIMTHGSLIT